jgi:hypothetical protein
VREESRDTRSLVGAKVALVKEVCENAAPSRCSESALEIHRPLQFREGLVSAREAPAEAGYVSRLLGSIPKLSRLLRNQSIVRLVDGWPKIVAENGRAVC